jgi:hypothetical protein
MNKNECQSTMSDGLVTIRAKCIQKTRWTSTCRAYEIWWYEQGMVDPNGKCQ